MSNQREGDVIVTQDMQVVAKGDRVYNYYDMWPGTIVTDPDEHGWFFVKPDKQIITVRRRPQQVLLNGERICSIAEAKRQGFPDA